MRIVDCQNTDTGLNIQHHLVTKDRRNKELHQEPRGTPRRSRGQEDDKEHEDSRDYIKKHIL